MPDHAESVEEALDEIIIDDSNSGPGDVARVTRPVDALIWVGINGDDDHFVNVVRRSPHGTWYPVRRQGTFDDVAVWLASYDEPVEIEPGPDRDDLPPTQ